MPEDIESEAPASDNAAPETEVVTETVDVSTYEAKIAALTAELAGHAERYASLEIELAKAKAANYDLMVNGTPVDENDINSPDDSKSDVDISDLFD